MRHQLALGVVPGVPARQDAGRGIDGGKPGLAVDQVRSLILGLVPVVGGASIAVSGATMSRSILNRTMTVDPRHLEGMIIQVQVDRK